VRAYSREAALAAFQQLFASLDDRTGSSAGVRPGDPQRAQEAGARVVDHSAPGR
jgi:hypothetical protein